MTDYTKSTQAEQTETPNLKCRSVRKRLIAQWAAEDGAQNQPLTLSDAQIDRVIERHAGGSELDDDGYESMHAFARAVLAAAQEQKP